MYGNYCGPWWSDGRIQRSVASGVTSPIDELDRECELHDRKYALGENLRDADRAFAENTIGRGFRSTLFGLLVGAQGMLRYDRNYHENNQQPEMKRNNLRGSNSNKAGERRPLNNTKQLNVNSNVSVTPVATSYGSMIRNAKFRSVVTQNGATAYGRDFCGTLYAQSGTSYEPAGAVPISPAYFQGSRIGNMCRSYEKYRFKRARITYVPSVPTSTSGQLVLCSARSIKEPFLDGSASVFLARALTQGNAVACALWQTTDIDIDCDNEWRLVDPFTDLDLDDSIAEELQAYAFASSTTAIGILMIDYILEFSSPIFTPHSTSIPITVGLSTPITFQDDSAVNATTDAIILDSSSFPLITKGAIYRLVFRQGASTLPTGPATWAAVANVMAGRASTTTGLVATLTNISMTTGTTIYGNASGSAFTLYSTIETARAGGNNGALYYQTATTAKGTWAFFIEYVGLELDFAVAQQ